MAVGYSGFAQFDDNGTKVTLLTTSSSINTNPNPIMSQAALGYGWANAPDTSHYAEGVLVYQGGIGFDFQAIDDVWGFLRDFAIYKRAFPKSLLYSPDGTRIYNYQATVGEALNDESSPDDFTGAWCESFGLSTSADQLVTANMNVIALTRTETDNGTGYFDNPNGYLEGANIGQFTNTQPLNPIGGDDLALNTSPVPFWKTTAKLTIGGEEQAGGTSSVQIMGWNINLSNNTQVIKTCSGQRKAMCVVCGPMAVDGSINLYAPGGVWDPVSPLISTGYNPIIAYNSQMSIDILGDGKTYTAALPAIMLQGDDYPLNVGAPVSRTFNLKGLGGKVGGTYGTASTRVPPLYMSAI
jgi:hypothetical protein